MPRMITITWTGDDTKITYSPSYSKYYDIARLDCLQDALCMLTEKYNQELEDFHKPKRKRN